MTKLKNLEFVTTFHQPLNSNGTSVKALKEYKLPLKSGYRLDELNLGLQKESKVSLSKSENKNQQNPWWDPQGKTRLILEKAYFEDSTDIDLFNRKQITKFKIKPIFQTVPKIKQNFVLRRYLKIKRRVFSFKSVPFSLKNFIYLKNLLLDLTFHNNFLYKAITLSNIKRLGMSRFRTVRFERKITSKIKKINTRFYFRLLSKQKLILNEKRKFYLLNYNTLAKIRLHFLTSRAFYNIDFFKKKINKAAMKKLTAFSVVYNKRYFFFSTLIELLRLRPIASAKLKLREAFLLSPKRFSLMNNIKLGKKKRAIKLLRKKLKLTFFVNSSASNSFKKFILNSDNLQLFLENTSLFFTIYSKQNVSGLFERKIYSDIKKYSLSFLKNRKKYRKFGLFFSTFLRKYKFFNYLGQTVFFRRFYNLRSKFRFKAFLRKKKKKKLNFFSLRKKFTQENALKLQQILTNFDDFSFMVNCIMKKGQRQKAIILFEKSLFIFKRELLRNYPKLKSKINPLNVRALLTIIITKFMPPLILIQKSIAGKKHKIPYLGSFLRRRRMTIRWLIEAARNSKSYPFEKGMRSHKAFSYKLAFCLLDILRRRGLFIAKRAEYLQEYEKGRLFLRYLKIKHSKDIDFVHKK
jgi:ribosomal protein S7